MKRLITILSLLSVLFSFPLSASAATTATSVITKANIQAFDSSSLIKTDGSYWVWGGNLSVPTQVTGLTDVAASFDFQFVMKRDNTVWYWERSTPSSASFKISPIKELNHIVSVESFGYDQVVVVNGDGKVYTIPQVDNKLDIAHITLISGIDDVASISSYFEIQDQKWEKRWVFLKKDGTVWVNRNELTSFESIQSLDHVVDIQQNMALKDDGTFWTWPSEFTAKELPVGKLTASSKQELANIQMFRTNGNTTIAIDKQSRLWFWGVTITGYSDGTEFHVQKGFKQLTSIKDVKDAYIVERSLIVQTNDGKVQEASIEREAMPDNPTFNLITNDINLIKGGGRHFIMQKNDGTLWGWGVNKNAQLGNGDYEFMHNIPVPVQQPVSIQLNGELIALTNGVITRNGQAFIPLRSIFEKLGATVTWNESKKVVTISRTESGKPSLTIIINLQSGEVTMDNKAVQLPNKPFGVNGTSYLPLRFISESLGAKVDWKQKEQIISISDSR
ncbi:hypothetical protein Back11_63500 [Paenibacillus baekrokdamisoli]|uniref:Copper amine oxidase-like N-terminal domain-containing protein n=1 Tax=Paenibacillus baekrokdamisoli TaxID=1712516 RepID=A0A3G9J9G9_9BACL|nr:stalk domain-containing protein [Paenibacillus baekrokdamisoli]MBB3069421.1 alpha-tubulin suppressor-like RCC1 family protein [Paenibacillus baekrokdamisoli]BBH25005.1 hypothetical protein Back11_63500 [Paenibacillus baekrokdamisoli]